MLLVIISLAVLGIFPIISEQLTYRSSGNNLSNWPDDIPSNVDRIEILFNRRLTIIPHSALAAFGSLTLATLYHNGIVGTDNKGPLIISSHLERLEFTINAFDSFHLKLSETSNGISNLKILSLSNNQLQSFPHIDQQIARSLETLWLQYNQLKVLKTEDLVPYVSLRQLTVSQNNIQTIYEFPLIGKASDFQLTIDGNPLHCDAKIMWLKNFQPPQKLTRAIEPCATPLNLVATNFDDIDIKEEGYCYLFHT